MCIVEGRMAKSRCAIFVCASTQAHVHQGDAVGNVRKLGLKQRRMSEK